MQELCAPSLSFDALWNDHCYRIFASLCHIGTQARRHYFIDYRAVLGRYVVDRGSLMYDVPAVCCVIVACSLDNNSDN